MTTHSNHLYHLVTPSPWPLHFSMASLFLTLGVIKWFHLFIPDLMYFSLLTIFFTLYNWWFNVTQESTYLGDHSLKVSMSLRMGMTLFIISEIMFFISFFWTFSFLNIHPDFDTNNYWPPIGTMPFNPLMIPLLNTMILLSSGISITWAHNALMKNNFNQMKHSMIITFTLGMYFMALQMLEYYESPFSIADSVYGSIFFISTGFHGMHVSMGTIFLIIIYNRHMLNQLSPIHHNGFEMAAWYWHFVDIVWLYLYILIYWWGK